MSAPRNSSLAEFPLVSHWLAFDADGRARVRSGRVDLGQGVDAAMVAIAAGALGVAPAAVHLVSGDTRECPDEGVTAGSLSVAVGGMAVRAACRAARALLLARAAELLQAEAGQLAVMDGEVLREGVPTGLTLAGLAAEVDLARPVADVEVPPGPQEAADTRPDLRARIAGGFIHDIALPGMLHGRPVHTPVVGAHLAELDAEGIAVRFGVAAVRDGSFVGFVGEREEAVAAAAATGRERAVWEGVGPAADPLATLAAATTGPEIVAEAGRVGEAFGDLHENTVSRPALSHGSIGPACALARWEGGRLTVWSHSQGVFRLRSALAEVLGIDEASVDVIHRPGAGCYGHNGADDVALDAALLARAAGRPVRVVWSRADEFATAPVGAPMITRASAVVADGRIAAMTVTATSPAHSARPGPGAATLRAGYALATPVVRVPPRDVPAARGGGADRNATPLYDIPAIRVEKRIVDLAPIRPSALRGLGAFLNVFAIETLMDDIAAAIGADPVAFRLDHLTEPRARAVLEAAARRAGWPRAAEDGAGWGVGLARYKNRAAWCAVVARVEVDEAVRLTDVVAEVDVGEVVSADGVRNQIEGGIVQSASWTLKEALAFEDGAVATRSWEDYPILTFPEVPRIAVGIAERPGDPPLGCGEAAQGPTAAAIGNAVFAALGVRVRALPLTRDAILAALA